MYYIRSGYAKSFYLKDGVEKNTGFFFENEIVTNVDSFATGRQSKYSIMACEPMTVVVFDRDGLFKVAKESIEIEALGRCCVRRFATKQEEWATVFQLYTPEERLEYLESKRPELLQRVPLSQLASFLGVARETLSRIRKRRILK